VAVRGRGVDGGGSCALHYSTQLMISGCACTSLASSSHTQSHPHCQLPYRRHILLARSMAIYSNRLQLILPIPHPTTHPPTNDSSSSLLPLSSSQWSYQVLFTMTLTMQKELPSKLYRIDWGASSYHGSSSCSPTSLPFR